MGIAYDSGKGEIFVANEGDGTVSILSDSNNSLVATVTVGEYPTGVAYDSGKGEIFVTNAGSDSVSVISDSTNKIVANVTVGLGPEGIAYDPGKGEIFVANTNYDSGGAIGTVSVISDSTNGVITNITVGVAPLYLVYDSGKSEIFVSDEGSAGNTVSVISDSSNQVVATVNGGPAPEGLAYDPAKGEIFIANYNAGSFSIISDSTNALLMTKQLGTYAGDPTDVTYDSGKGAVFLTCGDGVVYIISDSNNTAFAYAPLVQFPVSEDSFGPLPNGITYDPAKGEVYVADSGSNAVSNISDSFIIPGSTPSVSTPSAPQDLTVTPGTNEVTLSWSAPVNDGGANILSYSIYRSLSGSAYSQIGNVSAGTLSYVDNTGPAGNNYSYYVVALNSAGSGTQATIQSGSSTTTSTTSSSTSGDSYIIIGVVALIAVIGIVLFFMYGRRKSGSEEKTGNADRYVSPRNVASSENERGVISPVIERGDSNDSNILEQESTDQSKSAQAQETETIRQSEGPIAPQGERAERFRRLVNVFQQKGATSPEKAMTAQELGLPPRFEEYMDSRSGQTKIFIEVNGKYYLDQNALEEMRQRMASRIFLSPEH